MLPRPEIKRTDRSAQFALIAAREAWADAGAPDVDPERLGVVVASGIGGVTTLLDGLRHAQGEGRPPGAPDDRADADAQRPGRAGQPGVRARAGVHTPVSACASGAEAIASRST